MQYVLGNMLNGGGGLNADGLSLDLQFAADKTLTARKGPTPTFTRASSGTFVDSNGLIQTAATNTPRFDHTAAGVCRGLLIEESRTNLSLRSGALVLNSGWVSTEATLSASGTGPDGNTSYITSETSSTNTHNFLNTGSITTAFATSVISGAIYTGSIFLKKVPGGVDWIQLTFHGPGFGTSQYANFNIGNGTVGNSTGLASGTSPRIEGYGNGWYRCSISVTATATTSTTGNVLVGFINNTNGTTRLPSYTGSTSNSVLASLCQFEAGSFATSYIPTTTASVVRSADVCSITGADFSGMFNANDGTLFSNCSVDNTTGTNRGIANIRSGATFFMRQSLSSGSVRSELRAGDTQTNLGTTSVSILTAIKMALAYSGNDFASSTNGVSPSLVTRTLPTGLSEFRIGALDGTLCLNGHLVAIRYYRKRLPNAKLQALTV